LYFAKIELSNALSKKRNAKTKKEARKFCSLFQISFFVLI